MLPANLAPKHYQRRLIAYFDVLGWRTHIQRIGTNPAQIAVLHAIVRLLAMGTRPNLIPGAQPDRFYTSFSDHVVVSILPDASDLAEFLKGVGAMQLGVAVMGHFLRGAITVGDLYHDQDVVFGPGLIRAYDLESRVAKYPRIILDPDVQELRGISSTFIVEEDEYRMIDPFTEAFVEVAIDNPPPVTLMKAYTEALGIAPPTIPATRLGKIILSAILSHVGRELSELAEPSAKAKLNWLFDRLASRLTYPARAKDISS